MLIFIILCIIFVGSILLKHFDLFDDTFTFFGIIISGAILFFALLFLPMCYYSEILNIEQHKSMEKTIERARQNGRTIENAALQVEAIKQNKWLTKIQYWNDSIFDIYLPDECIDLKPIQ